MNFNFNKQAGLSNSTPFRGALEASRTQPLQAELKQLQAEKKPLKLTLGVEIEMIVANCTYPRRASGGFSRADTGKLAIFEVLNQLLEARCTTCGEKHKFKLMLRHPLMPFGESYSTWSVDDDSSIQLSYEEQAVLGNDLNYFDFYSVELRSSILRSYRPRPTTRSLSDPSHTHCVSYADEIAAVMARLNTVLDKEILGAGSRCSVFINNTCGLHVHVGNKHRGFPLRTVKNTLSTYVACERQIDAMHATNRIGGSQLPLAPQNRKHGALKYFNVIEPEVYNMPWSTLHSMRVYSRREQAARGSMSPEFVTLGAPKANDSYPRSHFNSRPEVRKAAYQYSAAAQVTLVQNAPDMTALRGLQGSHSHSSTIDLQDLRDFAPEGVAFGSKMTMEFRQHDGSLQSVEVLSWIDFLLRLVRHAHNTPNDKYADLCIGEFRSPSYSTLDLLKTLGCSQKTVNHYQQKLGMHTQGPSYADSLALQWFNQVGALGRDCIITPLLNETIKHRRVANHHEKIRARISKKFLQGGYGQFTDAFLDQVDFSSALAGTRESLRIGYINPETLPPSPEARNRVLGLGYVPRQETQPLLNDPATPATRNVHREPEDTYPRDPGTPSDSSAEFVGYALTPHTIVFDIQKGGRDTVQSPFTGSAYDEYEADGDINDWEDAESANSWTPLEEADLAGMHPSRRAMFAPRETAVPEANQQPRDVEEQGNVGVSGMRPRPLPAFRIPVRIVNTVVDRDNRDAVNRQLHTFALAPPPLPRRRVRAAAA